MRKVEAGKRHCKSATPDTLRSMAATLREAVPAMDAAVKASPTCGMTVRFLDFLIDIRNAIELAATNVEMDASSLEYSLDQDRKHAERVARINAERTELRRAELLKRK